MKNCLLLALALFYYINVSAQITSADTVCVYNTVPFTTPVSTPYYTWVTDTVNINQAPAATAAFISVSGLSTPTYPCVVNDNGTWYAFICNYSSGDVNRLTFSGNPNTSTFVTSLVGTYASGGKRMEGIDIVKDLSTGNWWGLVVSNDELIKLDFGSSLANTPVATTYNNTNMSWAHQVGLAKYGNQWVAFIADRNTTMVRVDFGTSMANTPTFTAIPNVGGVQNPCNFALTQEGGNWYMLVSNLITGTITRLNFGTNIQNNAPTGLNLGNPGSYLTLPRSVTIIRDCNQLYAYILNEPNSFMTKLDFNGSITNTPAVTPLYTKGITNCNGAYPYVVDSSLYLASLSYSGAYLYRIKMLTFPQITASKYYNPTFSTVYTTPGIKNITLYAGIASAMGGYSFCRSLVAAGGARTLRDTALCSGDSVLLDVSGSGGTSYTWNTGANTPFIKVATSGTYWVSIGGSFCVTGDTAHVQFSTKPPVSLGPDTTLCYTATYQLKNLALPVSGSSYLWSNFATTPTINVSANGVYALKVTANGCSNADTVNVLFSSRPPVDLGPDTSVCQGDSMILQSQYSSLTYTYLWSNGSTSSAIKVPTAGTYWVKVGKNGCYNSDTIRLNTTPAPTVDLGPDQLICDNSIVLLKNLTGQGTSFLWNNGHTTQDLYVSKAGTYWLKVFVGACSSTDTMVLSTKPAPIVYLGEDTAICKNEQITLHVNPQQPAGSTYLWNTGDTGTSITVNKVGYYSLTVGYDSCGTTDSIRISEFPDPEIFLGPDKDLCRGEKLTMPLSITTGPKYSIIWQNGSTDTSFTATDAGLYSVKLSNKCGVATDTLYLQYHSCNFYFPSAFSPNGDGQNDFAHLIGADLSAISNYELHIYNRWGQQVYHTNDVYSGWDGNFKGKAADLNVYVYYIKFVYKGENVMLKGNITLVR